MAYAQAILTRTHLLIVYTTMGHGTWIEVLPLPDAFKKDTLLAVSHTAQTPWFAGIKLLRATPSCFTLLAMTSDDVHGPNFIELCLEANGSIAIRDLPSYYDGDLTTDIIALHLTVGDGSTGRINARGIIISRGGAHAIRVSSAPVMRKIGVKVEVGEKLLASGKDIQTYGSFFDVHRGRFIYRNSLYQEEELPMVINIVDYA